MKEFIEKLIGRLEENGKCYARYSVNTEGVKSIPTHEAIEIVNQLAEEYNASFMQELVEARRNCSEDSDCSECPFGQIEDRCILAELKTDADNNGWIPCSSGVLPVGEKYEIYDEEEDITYHKHVWVKTDSVNLPYCLAFYDTNHWFDAVTNFPINVLAWRNIEPYQPKGE